MIKRGDPIKKKKWIKKKYIYIYVTMINNLAVKKNQEAPIVPK